jgi:hypothetical protein
VPESNESQGQGYEEQLTEEELILRIESASSRQNDAGRLHYKDEQKKATPEQVACWKYACQYFSLTEDLARYVLNAKLTDQLSSLSPEEQIKERDRWRLADKSSFLGKRHGYFTTFYSRDRLQELIESTRAELTPQVAAFRKAVRAFGLSEESDLWPGFLPTLPIERRIPKKKRSAAPIDRSNPFRKLIAGILIKRGIDKSYLEVAKRISTEDRALPDEYKVDKSAKTLDRILINNPELMTKFVNRVSDVRGALRNGNSGRDLDPHSATLRDADS